jgi:hypothetical protein
MFKVSTAALRRAILVASVLTTIAACAPTSPQGGNFKGPLQISGAADTVMVSPNANGDDLFISNRGDLGG